MRFPARRVPLMEQDSLSLLEQQQWLCDGKRAHIEHSHIEHSRSGFEHRSGYTKDY